ncbi:site-2 protease family protein [bacterium]|nr:site-2 protease family protein [bacterium]MBU1071805.1 site-2 protease family protein [bacterium]MBU1674526.1 site-2 protease family protein [bacterium]
MDVAIAILVLLFSLTVHESAHALAALRMGDDTASRMGRITLNPLAHIDPIGTIVVPLVMALLPGGIMFGWAKPVPVNTLRLRNPMRDHAVIAAAGPASNLVLAGVFAVLFGLLDGYAHARLQSGIVDLGAAYTFLRLLTQWGVLLNILLALFNLIPLPPLDGSWIMMAALKDELARSYARLYPYGFLLVIVLMNVGLGRLLWRGVLYVSAWYLQISNLVSRIFV